MRTLPPVPAHRRGVFTAQDAVEAGWTRSALAHAVRRGRLDRLAPGVFVPVGPSSIPASERLAVATIGALIAHQQAVASHAAAAVLAGLPVWKLPSSPCLTVRPRYTGDAASVHLHRASLPDAHLALSSPQRRTSAARTIVDLARESGRLDAVVAGDAALAAGLVTPAKLAACLTDCQRWPGVRTARAAISQLDGRSESPLESVSRVRLADIGLPHPDLQPDILTGRGVFIGRVDVYWDEYGVAGEVDGRSKYDGHSPDALWNEKRRQERLEDCGLVVVRWGHADLMNLPRLATRLRRAFARGLPPGADARRWQVRPRSEPTIAATLPR
jgi:hypothetical protein